MKNASVVLILLAAGSSTRFGTDKLSFQIDGMPMLSRCIRFYAKDSMSSIIAKRILVTQPFQERFIREAEALGYEIALNTHPELGISESIRIGLEKTNPSEVDGYLFSVADQPYLTEKTVLGVLAKFKDDTSKIIAPAAEGQSGNPVVFPASYYKELFFLEGDCGGKQIVRKHLGSTVIVEAEKWELKDIDVEPEVSL